MECTPIPFDPVVVERRHQIARDLRSLLSAESVIDDEIGLGPYESDALTAHSQLPLAVALPAETEEVASVLRYCSAHQLKLVPRGAGTSLSGGSLPLGDGIVLGLSKLNQILDIDYANRCAVVQPGVTNLAITRAVEADGFYYAPDPSSQIACSIGGNVAENSGGVHCLKYGLTTHNLLGLKMVLPDGDIIEIGGRHLDAGGYDLLGLMTGSEGLLGIITEVTVRLLPKPQHIGAMMLGFPTVEDAGACVAEIISSGMIPAGMEMMDKPAIHAAEAFVQAGYPLDVEALLLIEIDGTLTDIELMEQRIRQIADIHAAQSCEFTLDADERARYWAGRKSAFPAAGRLSPDYLCMDGTIPRRALPDVLSGINRLSQAHGLGVMNVFHAGDGNLHPLILYDAAKPGELARAEAFGGDILTLCVQAGGVLTGEHGVGVEKRELMPLMFNETDLDQQLRVKLAFDPHNLMNRGKVFPLLHRCAEHGRMHVHQGATRFPDLPRF